MAVHTHHESTSQETSALHTSASYEELQFLSVFIYLHIIAFSLELRLESGKLWHLGFVSLIPYLPEEPEVMHLSMWGLVSLKNILFSCLRCSLKCGVCPTDPESPEEALQLRLIVGRQWEPGGQPWQVCVAVCCPPLWERGGEADDISFSSSNH